MKKLTQEEFVQKAREIHGDRYDYSQAVYSGNKTPVTIGCSVHGSFLQIPNGHMSGRGCPDCGKLSGAINNLKSKEWFVNKARSVHGYTYDYSEFAMSDINHRSTIICPEHGGFQQSANKHLKGHGCPYCGRAYTEISRFLGQSEFIRRSSLVHGDRYDYSKSLYKGSQIKVDIVCREHGVFRMTPDGHFAGQGCPVCAKKGFDPLKPAWLYLVNLSGVQGEYLGYGITGTLKRRMRTHARNANRSGFSIELLECKQFEKGKDAERLERTIRNRFRVIDTGIDGFIREATDIVNLHEIRKLLSRF